MASNAKRKTTMAKLARERNLLERRERKQAKKQARRRAADAPSEPSEPPAAEPPADLR
jgi:hypothetical protein